VALGLCRRPAFQGIAWLGAMIIGVGLPIFDAPRIDPTTDRFYIFSVSYLPIGIAALSLLALIILRGQIKAR
jgi:quinol-cytochrome oxidoreductase complex cytochrome b subunit